MMIIILSLQAYGVALQALNRVNRAGKTIPGWKVVYSGDTRPCPPPVEAAQCATVLIHEASFDGGGGGSEPLHDQGSSGSRRFCRSVSLIILTHFSQRYPKIPVFDENHMHKMSIAFNMMSVNLGCS